MKDPESSEFLERRFDPLAALFNFLQRSCITDADVFGGKSDIIRHYRILSASKSPSRTGTPSLMAASVVSPTLLYISRMLKKVFYLSP